MWVIGCGVSVDGEWENFSWWDGDFNCVGARRKGDIYDVVEGVIELKV